MLSCTYSILFTLNIHLIPILSVYSECSYRICLKSLFNKASKQLDVLQVKGHAFTVLLLQFSEVNIYQTQKRVSISNKALNPCHHHDWCFLADPAPSGDWGPPGHSPGLANEVALCDTQAEIPDAGLALTNTPTWALVVWISVVSIFSVMFHCFHPVFPLFTHLIYN